MQEIDIEVVGFGLNIHEHRFRSDQPDHFSRADPGEGDGDDFVSGADAQGAQSDLEAGGAAGDGDAVFHGDIPGELGLQFDDLRSHDEVAVRQHAPHTLVDLRFIFAVLRFEIYELHVV